MPRGQSSCTGEWNFRVKRYVCPSCNRKGLYSDYTYEHHSWRKAWICMYRNCVSKKTHETYFRRGNDEAVIAANPELHETTKIN